MFLGIRLFGTALLLLTAVPGIATTSQSRCPAPTALITKVRAHPTAENYSALGSWFGDHQLFSCAAQAYRSATRLAPKSPQYAYLYGLNLYWGGRSAEAIAPLQKSVELAPEEIKGHIILASAFDRMGRKSEAKDQWQAALTIDPHSAAALDGMSKSLLQEQHDAAVIDLLRTADLNEDLTVDLAQAYVNLKMLDDADRVLSKGLAKVPSSTALQLMQTRVAIQQFHYQEAEKLAKENFDQHPQDPEVQRIYLQTLVLAGNTTEARPFAKKLLEASPNDFQYLYLSGFMENDAGDYQAAREHLEKAVQVNPNLAAARFTLGSVLAQLNETEGAKEQLEKAVQLGAEEPEVHLQLGKVLHKLGDTAGAAEQLKLYQQGLKNQHDRALADSKVGQGDKEMESGDPHKALAYYREALAAVPDDAQINYKLAVAFDKTGNLAGERAALEKAIQINPDLAVAQNQLGFLDSQSGNRVSAEKHFREAVRAAPRFTEAWVNLAATLGLQSRFTEAQDAVTNALRIDPQNPQALLLRDTIAKALAQR
jgi:tetratricopeptide (TPR) repeat protein